MGGDGDGAGRLAGLGGGDLNPVTFKAAPRHAAVALVRDGKALGVIALMSAEPSRKLQAAVAEMQECIEKTTGARLPMVKDPGAGPAIVIGDCPAAETVGLLGTKMPIEGFTIKTAPGRVFIVGHDGSITGSDVAVSEGTAWGVYEFLERYVGVRWYWPTDRGGRSLIPSPNLMVPPTWPTDAPVFRMRVIWPDSQNSYNGSGEQLGALHAALRSNDAWPVELQVHTPHWEGVPGFVKDKPEIFQLRSDGTRNTAMICYGNPRTLQTYLEEIARVYDHGEKVDFTRMGIHGNAITVSPNDMDIACSCPDCRKLWDEKAGHYGRPAKIMANFVQKLAVEVKKRWPDKTIVFLPYQNYTQAPDGYTFPGNVEVQICGMPGLAMYKEPSVNAEEQANIDKWMKISGHKVQNWHYSCWPEDRIKAPYQYPHVIQQFYRANRNKTVGSFINGTTDHWPRQHVSLYAWMKVLWNPDFNVDAAIDAYCCRMYGPAAKTMRELVSLEIDGWEKSRWPGGILSPKAVYTYSYPAQTVQRMQALLEQARKEAGGNTEVLAHIDYFATPYPDFIREYESVVEGKGVHSIVVQKVGENPVMDGKLDDAVWQKAAPVLLMGFGDSKEATALYPTEVRAVWTLDGITFGFRMAEPSPATLVRDIKGRDDSLAWWNDNVELFLDVSGDRLGDNYQFIINPNGALFDAHNGDVSWNSQGVKTASALGADSWTLEVYIPYATFPNLRKPSTGVEWFGQLTRHRLSDAKTNTNHPPEYQRLNTKFGGPSNNQADFAPIKFVE